MQDSKETQKKVIMLAHTHTHTHTQTHTHIQSVSGGIVNILGGGRMDYSE